MFKVMNFKIIFVNLITSCCLASEFSHPFSDTNEMIIKFKIILMIKKNTICDLDNTKCKKL